MVSETLDVGVFNGGGGCVFLIWSMLWSSVVLVLLYSLLFSVICFCLVCIDVQRVSLPWLVPLEAVYRCVEEK